MFKKMFYPIFMNFLVLACCYLGFVQNIIFFKVAYFIYNGIVTLLISLLFLVIMIFYDNFIIKFKDSVHCSKPISYLKSLYGFILLLIQLYFTYPSYPILASIYFIFLSVSILSLTVLRNKIINEKLQ